MKFTGVLSLFTLAATASAFTVTPSKTVSTTLSATGAGRSPGVLSKTADWELNKISPVIRIEGETRHTFDFEDHSKEVVQISMHSPNGRPINAEVSLWIGPDWTPVSIKAHSEDGTTYPIQTLIGTRNKSANVEIKNTGIQSFPVNAACSYAIAPLADAREEIKSGHGQYIEGGAIEMEPIPAGVNQLQVLLTTDGKQLHAMIELLNGPNNVKASYEVFTNNGQLNSLFVVFDTPSEGCAFRVKNLAPLEFPLMLYSKPSKTGQMVSTPKWN
jgi:hypothetical protein